MKWTGQFIALVDSSTGPGGQGTYTGGHGAGGKGLGWGTQEFTKTIQQKHYKT